MRLLALAFSICAVAQDLPPRLPASVLPDMHQTGSLVSFIAGVDGQMRRDTITPPGPTPRDVIVSVMRDELHCTDHDIQAIQEAGAEFERRANAIRSRYGNYVFEARLEFADKGEISKAFLQKMERMNSQLAELESRTERELKTVVGEERFQAIDAWVRSPESKRCRIAPCPVKR